MHEALDGASGDPVTFTVELGPDLVGAIDATVLVEDPDNLRTECFVAHRPR